MSNIKSTAIVPINTKKGTPVIVNCVPYVVCDELPDCPCAEWTCPDGREYYYKSAVDGTLTKTDNYCNATHVSLPIEHTCCADDVCIEIDAVNPIHVGDGVYLPSNAPGAVVDAVTPTNDPASGARWGMVTGFSRPGVGYYDALGADNALSSGDTGIGTAYVTMLPPCCGCQASPDEGEDAP